VTTRTAVLGALMAGCLLAGCSHGGTAGVPTASRTPSGSPTTSAPSPTAAPTASQVAASTPPFPANTLADTAQPTGGPLGLRVARVAPQPGYDRVVLELAGKVPGQPGWRVEYVTQPTSDGSGNPVAVRGTAYLQVIVTGVGYPADTGVPEPAIRRIRPAGTAVVREVVLDGVFEGQYTAFVGLTGKRPFRVFRLSNPARVVIDVRRT
jgi:hypothetical protein